MPTQYSLNPKPVLLFLGKSYSARLCGACIGHVNSMLLWITVNSLRDQ